MFQEHPGWPQCYYLRRHTDERNEKQLPSELPQERSGELELNQVSLLEPYELLKYVELLGWVALLVLLVWLLTELIELVATSCADGRND